MTSKIDLMSKPNMLSGVQTRNGIQHDRYNICGITHARTNRKDNFFMQRQLGQIFTCILEGGQGAYKKSKTIPGPSLHNLSCAGFVFLRTSE